MKKYLFLLTGLFCLLTASASFHEVPDDHLQSDKILTSDVYDVKGDLQEVVFELPALEINFYPDDIKINVPVLFNEHKFSANSAYDFEFYEYSFWHPDSFDLTKSDSEVQNTIDVICSNDLSTIYFSSYLNC